MNKKKLLISSSYWVFLNIIQAYIFTSNWYHVSGTHYRIRADFCPSHLLDPKIIRDLLELQRLNFNLVQFRNLP